MNDSNLHDTTAQTISPHESDELTDETVDAVVIGGGAAGLNGALILARSRRSVIVIDNGSPRNAPAATMHGFIVLDGTPPLEILQRGREQVRQYGGRVLHAEVVSTEPSTPSAHGDLRFIVTLADGRAITTRRVLVATGLTDVLPDVPGLSQHWGHSVVHCPYCHGWELRDESIGILATSAASIGHAYLFRQLTEDLIYFTNGTDLDDDTRARFAARDIRIIDTAITEIVNDDTGALAGVRLTDEQIVTRSAIAVVPQLQARTRGLDGLDLPHQDLPNNGRSFASGDAGSTQVPGVWVAGNATDPVAQVGASAAAGALAGDAINRSLAIADTDAALKEVAVTT